MHDNTIKNNPYGDSGSLPHVSNRRRIDAYLARRDSEYAAGVSIFDIYERDLVCRTCGFVHDELTCPRWAFDA